MSDRYVPAAGRAALTRLYDPAMALTMRERRWRPALVEAATRDAPPGATIVDVGTGTGAVALRIAAARPDCRVVAVDGDDEALAIARRKPGADRVAWTDGYATELPLGDASAHRVVLSLLLHHLADDDKRRALREVARILRAGGRLHVADWGRPAGLLPRAGFRLVRLLDGHANTRAHATGSLPAMLAGAGLTEVTVDRRLATAGGTLELLTARATSAAPRGPDDRRDDVHDPAEEPERQGDRLGHAGDREHQGDRDERQSHRPQGT